MSQKINQHNFTGVMYQSFHKKWMSAIKKELGSSCSFLAHTSRNGEHFVKATIQRDGFKDTVEVKIDGSPNTLTSKNYKELLSLLKDQNYEKGN